MERDQCRFRHGTDEDQYDGGGHGPRCRPAGQLRSLLQDGRNPVGSGAEPQDDEAHQHGQAARRGDHQGLQRRAPGGEPGAGVADQQIRQDGGEFPEDEHQEQVVGRDQAEHRPGEGQELGAEAAEVAVLVLEVARAVDQHQRAHPEHQQGHDPGEGVHPEREFDLEFGDPGQDLGDCAARGRGCRGGLAGCALVHGVALQKQPDERACGDRGQRVERVPAEFPEQERRHSGHREMHGKDCDHWLSPQRQEFDCQKLEQAVIRQVRCRQFIKRMQTLLTRTRPLVDGFPVTPGNFHLPLTRRCA